jgi:hypothetical protein
MGGDHLRRSRVLAGIIVLGVGAAIATARASAAGATPYKEVVL